MKPILHKNGTSSINVQNLNWGNHWRIMMPFLWAPYQCFEGNSWTDNNVAPIEKLKIFYFFLSFVNGNSYFEKILLVFKLVEFIFVFMGVPLIKTFQNIDDGFGISNIRRNYEIFSISKTFPFTVLFTFHFMCQHMPKNNSSEFLNCLLFFIFNKNIVWITAQNRFVNGLLLHNSVFSSVGFLAKCINRTFNLHLFLSLFFVFY